MMMEKDQLCLQQQTPRKKGHVSFLRGDGFSSVKLEASANSQISGLSFYHSIVQVPNKTFT